jgi:hypothetical protein
MSIETNVGIKRELRALALRKGSCVVCKPRLEELGPVLSIDWEHGSLILCQACLESLRRILEACRDDAGSK